MRNVTFLAVGAFLGLMAAQSNAAQTFSKASACYPLVTAFAGNGDAGVKVFAVVPAKADVSALAQGKGHALHLEAKGVRLDDQHTLRGPAAALKTYATVFTMSQMWLVVVPSDAAAAEYRVQIFLDLSTGGEKNCQPLYEDAKFYLHDTWEKVLR